MIAAGRWARTTDVFCCTEPPRKDPKSAFVVVAAVVSAPFSSQINPLLVLSLAKEEGWPWRADVCCRIDTAPQGLNTLLPFVNVKVFE